MTAALQVGADNILWYQQPAGEWMEAMPAGNGRLSAMVYGGIARERIAFGEISLWSGKPDASNNDICGKDKLDEMRRCFFNGDPERGNELGNKYLNGLGRRKRRRHDRHHLLGRDKQREQGSGGNQRGRTGLHTI